MRSGEQWGEFLQHPTGEFGFTCCANVISQTKRRLFRDGFMYELRRTCVQLLSVNIFPIAYFDNPYNQLIIMNFIKYSVIALPDPVNLFIPL